jgi:hypothetical protein
MPLAGRRRAPTVAKTRVRKHDIRFVIAGDFGKDPDDEVSLLWQNGELKHRIFLKTSGSRKQDLFELAAVVANLAPAIQRARLAKGMLRELGQPTVRVGIGTDCGHGSEGHEAEFEDIPYLADYSDLEDGADLLRKTLEAGKDDSVTLVLISGLTDVANLLREHHDLVKRKVKSVAVMGGVQQQNDAVVLDADGFMNPDTAANNAFDMGSAVYFYRRIQELAIPMTILTREAAYACPVPRSIYERLAATGHPVGIKLLNSQRYLIEDLWRRANLPGDDPARKKLPARCDKKWFCTVFCAGMGLDRTSADSIWDLIQSFNLYDPMTLIAAIPKLCRRFYDPTEVAVNGITHQIIGVSKKHHGVRDGKRLARYMTQRFLLALTAKQE